MGAVRKVVSMQTKHLTKKEREQRTASEAHFKIDRRNLKPPDWLSDEAAEEFKRVVKEAAKASFLDNLDLSVLAIYADNYQRYVEASVNLRDEGMVITTDKGYSMQSPYIAIVNHAAKNILSCSAKLGLATTDRLKLMVPTKNEEPANKFLKYLGGAGG